jgi:hypothetical protein
MKILSYIASVCIVVVLLLLTACSKKGIQSYQQDARLYFRIPGEYDSTLSRDSLVYSFLFKTNTYNTVNKAAQWDTVVFEADIMGSPMPTNRVFAFNIDTVKGATTARRGRATDIGTVDTVDYVLLDSVVYAGMFKAKARIAIHNPLPSMSTVLPMPGGAAAPPTIIKRLQLSVKANSNFGVGYANYLDTNYKANVKSSRAVIVWSNKFLLPDTWTVTSNYSSAFGGFSQNVMGLLRDSLGFKALPNQSNYEQMKYYNQLLRNAYNNYQKKYPSAPLKNDAGTSNIYVPTMSPGVG